MIGVYDYTVILTYLSAVSAGFGILTALSGSGHPYIAAFCLMFCGLCDAFDGKVASTKKNRTEQEKKFGIQIDSLSDILAFGILPVCIGASMIRISPQLHEAFNEKAQNRQELVICIILYIVMLFYMLAGLIRLAYFNVNEDERQNREAGRRKFYEGLPITSASLIFPTILLLQYLFAADITIVYFAVMLLAGIAFITKIRIGKPGMRGILIMVAIGAAEFVLYLIALSLRTQGL